MIIGCCTSTLPKTTNDIGYEYAEDIQKAGFDYIDLPIAQITEMPEADFKNMLSYLKSVGLPVYACNNFLGPQIKLVIPGQDPQVIRDFYRKALERAEAMGAKYIGFGSPWAKQRPEDMSYDDAFAKIVEWYKEIAAETEQYQLALALEPNNHTETNMINKYEEVVAIAKAVDHPKMKCLQDYYQMRMENDTVDSMIAGGGELLLHSHMATYPKRGYPVSMDEDSYYKTYFETLHKLGYDGGISQEGLPMSKETFFEEAVKAREFIRHAWEVTA